MNILICGSRDASSQMTDYATRCVFRASFKGHSIIVGDAAGVDAAVVIACRLYNVPCTIYGITETPRCTRQVEAYGLVMKYLAPMPPYIRCEGDFLARDRVMAEACDMCLGIWNGRSTGTMYTVNHARKLGKETHLRTFER